MTPDGTLYRTMQNGKRRQVRGFIDEAKVAATTEADIARHIREDEAEARAEAGGRVRNIRLSTGLSQADFAERICVSLDRLRNWEQARRMPQGPARALLRALERAPKTVIKALTGW
jgi:putative transcriptional regulator